mgnify:CR=1 FL=1
MSLNQFTTQSAWKSLTENVIFTFSWSAIGEWLFYTFSGYNEISNNNFLLDNTKNPTPQIKGFYMCQLNFSTTGASNNNIILQLGYGKNEVLGSELITDGSNANAGASWNINPNWNGLVVGLFSCDGTTNDNMNQEPPSAESGKKYILSFEVLSINAGGNFIMNFGGVVGTERTAVGVYSQTITATSTDRVKVRPNRLGTIGGVTGISIKEILTTESIEWSDAQLEFDSKGGNKWSTNLNALVHVKDVGDTLGVELAIRTANTNQAFRFQKYSNNTITYDVGNTIITYVDDSGGAYSYFNSSYAIPSDLVIGITYKISITFKINLGNVTFRIFDGVSVSLYTQETSSTSFITQNVYMTAQSTTNCFIKTSSIGTGQVVTISDMSVKEVTIPASTFQLRGQNTDGTNALNINTLNANFIKLY